MRGAAAMNSSLEPRRFAGSTLQPGDAAIPSGMDKQALVWGWFAEIFSNPPSLETLVSYRHGRGAEWLADLYEMPELTEGIACMIGTLAEPTADDRLVVTLGTTFNRLFVGVGGRSTVAPYESAYRGNGRLFQQPFTEMNALMREFGLTLGDGCAEPADHISIELALMSHLLFAADPASQTMLERLRGWVPAFCADCIATDTSGFWAGAAQALAALTARQGPYVDHRPMPTQGG